MLLSSAATLPVAFIEAKPTNRLTMLAASLLLASCGGGSSSNNAASNPTPVVAASCSVAQLEAEIGASLALAPSEVDFSFAVERADGRRYTYHRGASTLDTSYESASSSKLVTAVIILRLVELGYLKLTDQPQARIAAWPIAANDTLHSMTLSQLLSFTAGLNQEPACINLPNANFESCVNSIATANAGNDITPGQEFYYGGSYLQVAGLMAIKARGVASWQDIFTEFKTQTGLFAHSSYDLPSSSNPRLAGGMHWSGNDYMAFLSALKKGKLLSPASMDLLLADRTASAKITYSPITSLGEVWHYGYGLWQECQSASYNCTPGSRVSSPGAYGAYPYWDRAKAYTGLVARQGKLGTYNYGLAIERAARPKVEAWLACK
jgi:CubicO group peptidase (beta-lactamase class C family)